MSESNALYRVQFICHSERYEVYVREVNQGQLFGFIEIAHFVWDNHTALIVDPSHEKLKSEFADVTAPYSHAPRAAGRSGAQAGAARITELGNNVTYFPGPIYTKKP